MNAALTGSSGRVRDKSRINRDQTMLARRFTIICLLTALFGMCLASIVVHSDPSPRFAYGRHATCTPSIFDPCR